MERVPGSIPTGAKIEKMERIACFAKWLNREATSAAVGISMKDIDVTDSMRVDWGTLDPPNLKHPSMDGLLLDNR